MSNDLLLVLIFSMVWPFVVYSLPRRFKQRRLSSGPKPQPAKAAEATNEDFVSPWPPTESSNIRPGNGFETNANFTLYNGPVTSNRPALILDRSSGRINFPDGVRVNSLVNTDGIEVIKLLTDTIKADGSWAGSVIPLEKVDVKISSGLKAWNGDVIPLSKLDQNISAGLRKLDGSIGNGGSWTGPNIPASKLDLKALKHVHTESFNFKDIAQPIKLRLEIPIRSPLVFIVLHFDARFKFLSGGGRPRNSGNHVVVINRFYGSTPEKMILGFRESSIIFNDNGAFKCDLEHKTEIAVHRIPESEMSTPQVYTIEYGCYVDDWDGEYKKDFVGDISFFEL